MNENNVNHTPNAESDYQQSGQPYPQSGYPQSGYPQSGIPYTVPEYVPEKKSKTWQIALISVVAVLIIALATTLIVVLNKRNNMPIPDPIMQNGTFLTQPMGTRISISENGSTINGQPATIAFFIENGKAYLKLEDISKTAGYDYILEGDRIKLLSQLELAIIEVGSAKVTLQDQTSKKTTSVEILKAPFNKDGDVYIYARDLSVFMKNTNVSYNSMTKSVEISINAGMGGPGGMPPGGMMPQQGPLQPPVPQTVPQPTVPQQNNTFTQENEESLSSPSESQGIEQQPPQGAQPLQGAQPPQGTPGTPPSHN